MISVEIVDLKSRQFIFNSAVIQLSIDFIIEFQRYFKICIASDYCNKLFYKETVQSGPVVQCF